LASATTVMGGVCLVSSTAMNLMNAAAALEPPTYTGFIKVEQSTRSSARAEPPELAKAAAISSSSSATRLGPDHRLLDIVLHGSFLISAILDPTEPRRGGETVRRGDLGATERTRGGKKPLRMPAQAVATVQERGVSVRALR